jgi:excisionase family DNA binding protein
MQNAPQFITISEAADLWHVHPRTVRRRIAEGALTAYRVGPHLIRIDANELKSVMVKIPNRGAQ